MNNKKAINLKEAAALAGMTPSLFIYYLNTYGLPEHEIVAGRKLFNPIKVKEWTSAHNKK